MIRYGYRFVKKKLNNLFISPSIKALKVLPCDGVVSLLDIGAADQIEPRWKPFVQFLNYVGVEPDERSRSKLLNIKENFRSYQIIPYVLADKAKLVNFNLCRKPQVSSIYEPNAEFLSRFPDAKRYDIVEKVTTKSVCLDNIDVPNVDFLKIDVQGGELDILKGGIKKLKSVLGVELEVEFINLYRGQPLFGDVCKELSQHEFEFIDFISLARWERKVLSEYGQCVFGDALFLRSPESPILQSFGIDKWTAYFAVLLIYRRFDLIETAIEKLPDRLKSEFESFGLAFRKVRSIDTVVRKIHLNLSRFFSLFCGSIRIHLIQ